MSDERLVHDVSDTARWAAYYRGRENEREDPLFRDPFAARLAGERGRRIAELQGGGDRYLWAWAIRTHLFDRYVLEQMGEGIERVVSLGAGLDARPYRLELPASLAWVEVDHPGILAEKGKAFGDAPPACEVERVGLDLADLEARRALFSRLDRDGRRTLVLSEGLLLYLTRDAVVELARDLAEVASFRRWALELQSPGLLARNLEQHGELFRQAGSVPSFAPEEGPEFFAEHGWRLLVVRSTFKAAARAGRLPFFLRLLAILPESSGRQGSSPWQGVCLYANAETDR